MADERKLETLQEEIKLLKGEVKNSLASVREYLLNMELPSSEFSTMLAALNADGGVQKITIDGKLANTKGTEPEKPEAEETEEEIQDEVGEEATDELEQPAEDEDLINVEEPPEDETEELSDESSVDEDESLNTEDSLPPEDESVEDEELDTSDEQDEALTPESELPVEEEQPMEYDRTTTELSRTTTELSQLTPKVNMLANLINWVARAKKEIGYEQIPTFLEVYGISGHLSSELKEVIIHLSEITKERPEIANNAEVWSQAMLALHGIITGGDAPLHPLIPSWTDNANEIQPVEEEIIEIDKAKEKPIKLKLVFPDGNGKSKEFCINLSPEENSNNSPSSPEKE